MANHFASVFYRLSYRWICKVGILQYDSTHESAVHNHSLCLQLFLFFFYQSAVCSIMRVIYFSFVFVMVFIFIRSNEM